MPIERPIIFSTEMVRALLENRKSQTRRLIKGRDLDLIGSFPVLDENSIDLCRYGKVGDKLWVREKIHCYDGNVLPKSKPKNFTSLDEHSCNYAADEISFPDIEYSKVISPIFMPRWCCRIELVLTEVSIERVGDISEADAIAEGVKSRKIEGQIRYGFDHCYYQGNPRNTFAKLWNNINTAQGTRFVDNPWVWVLKFDVRKSPRDRSLTGNARNC